MAGHPRRKPDTYGLEIAAQMRSVLAAHNLRQRRVAELTSISTSQLSQYFRGEKSPTVDEFIEICIAMDIPPQEVFTKAIETVAARHRQIPGVEAYGATQRMMTGRS
ncbi:helix-turn-helix domain-containing protein [Corynebacterium choanae]|uniref:Helix-turn-helix protein n=1 Tax=Corynebacterium choanae TaxID=1862358 RepID=A0A3G6J3G4_9CORY|nr:helix-turn-helix transcriptional regulator [Corynebacterium choanae]AZA12611.1 Helix-turn-helix protein [Corynebacterium choanae]